MKRPVTVAFCALIALGAGGCGERSARAGVPALVDRTPDKITALVARSGADQVEFRNTGDGIWDSRGNAAPGSAAIMFEAQKTFFPLLAYHTLPTKQAKPEFGLQEPAYVLTAEDESGTAHTVFIGAETFNGEGYYARRPKDPHIYLIPRAVVTHMRSLLAGEQIRIPHPVEAKFDEIADRAERAEDVPDVWLTQASEAGADLPEDLR
jgi:hypothetical protein